MGKQGCKVENLWSLPAVTALLRKQQPDGSWRYPHAGQSCADQDYDQLETYRVLGWLVEKYGLNRRHPAIRKAAEFMFRRQTRDGDFRGIYSRQYTPNYTGAIIELLVKAGYASDPGIRRGFTWLLASRQDDGGWALPILTAGRHLNRTAMSRPAEEPHRNKPFSHLITGMVLRAFAAHPKYAQLNAARNAGSLLASRLFQRDAYSGRDTPDFWLKCSYPFWYTDVVSALDSLSRLGFSADHPPIAQALKKLRSIQRRDGSFDLKILRTGTDEDAAAWISLAVCRVFKRFSTPRRQRAPLLSRHIRHAVQLQHGTRQSP